MSHIRTFTEQSRETFYRGLATLAIVILGGLAWYGLHQDIEHATNPCITEPHGQACVRFACNFAEIQQRPLGPRCVDALHIQDQEAH